MCCLLLFFNGNRCITLFSSMKKLIVNWIGHCNSLPSIQQKDVSPWRWYIEWHRMTRFACACKLVTEAQIWIFKSSFYYSFIIKSYRLYIYFPNAPVLLYSILLSRLFTFSFIINYTILMFQAMVKTLYFSFRLMPVWIILDLWNFEWNY